MDAENLEIMREIWMVQKLQVTKKDTLPSIKQLQSSSIADYLSFAAFTLQ